MPQGRVRPWRGAPFAGLVARGCVAPAPGRSAGCIDASCVAPLRCPSLTPFSQCCQPNVAGPMLLRVAVCCCSMLRSERKPPAQSCPWPFVHRRHEGWGRRLLPAQAPRCLVSTPCNRRPFLCRRGAGQGRKALPPAGRAAEIQARHAFCLFAGSSSKNPVLGPGLPWAGDAACAEPGSCTLAEADCPGIREMA